jgi:hypothetical protein
MEITIRQKIDTFTPEEGKKLRRGKRHSYSNCYLRFACHVKLLKGCQIIYLKEVSRNVKDTRASTTLIYRLIVI